MRRAKRVLVIHNRLDLLGGGSALAAWVLQALSSPDYQVSVLTWGPVDVGTLNRSYGTSLDQSGIRWFRINTAIRWLLDAVPCDLFLLRYNLLFRTARRLHAKEPFDVIFGSLNECYVGTRAIQYIHHPHAFENPNRGDVQPRYLKPILTAYRQLCYGLSGYSSEGVAENETLANSRWTARFVEAQYAIPVRVVYPPVPGGFPTIPWAERDTAFVCIGRIAPDKEVEKIIGILARVRDRGHDLRLHIVGAAEDSGYLARVKTTAAPHMDWISFHVDLSRHALVEIVGRSRYGIHGMAQEHFGIAPAELQRGGCITFVPDDGGQLEIVAGDTRLIYHSPDDGVEKVHRVLSDPSLQSALRKELSSRAEHFSEHRFMAEMRDVVEGFKP